jgi:uncharacterized protein YodC (DUF2158 family)
LNDMKPLHSHAVGDRVRLNSGGPEMLVVDLTKAAVVVAWRDSNGYLHDRTYPNQCVYRIDEPSIQSSI